jgi:hypothetical protein
MASPLRHKMALKGALLAYLAGMHAQIREASRVSIEETDHSEKSEENFLNDLQAMLNEDYERALTSGQVVAYLVDFLNEEDLYPFGSEWPEEEMLHLIEKIKAPTLNLDGSEEENELMLYFLQQPKTVPVATGHHWLSSPIPFQWFCCNQSAWRQPLSNPLFPPSLLL